jgi:hypothetical protein
MSWSLGGEAGGSIQYVYGLEFRRNIDCPELLCRDRHYGDTINIVVTSDRVID